ncbi:tyrosine-protein phosphatase [Hydrogenophaga sp.]|uniref:tyrosine-protein phosphatase n=1 Tax=Hydrogenophaga sp. TaxID=1904254 RepID=UPI0027268931|nr:CpsB/CapC family capsule biosynthesis tyrosine phosphatase [Hydrogenophaga sp.]MDO9439159.1 CpsB/CapC family capsule biosynthesis tyrosine phosphatase [Hydrogenophaga sp.]
MIDLHCHILPGIDDGAKTLADSLEMARIAVDDGIHTLACTPHIYPGMYMNDGPGITLARARLQAELDERGIALKLVVGADVHLVPGLMDGLKSGRVPTLHGSRYFLLEPSHTTPPPHLEDSVFNLIASGYTPIVTHPERLSWVETHYPVFLKLIEQGAWMQVTAGALTGVFGKRAKYWGERFIGEGHTHLLATDAHSTGRRLPRLTEGLAVARRLVGDVEAGRLVGERADAVLRDLAPEGFGLTAKREPRGSMIGRWFSKAQPR